MIRSENIAHLIDPETQEATDDPLVILPRPNGAELKKAGSASVDLRLGTWIATFRAGRSSLLEVGESSGPKMYEPEITQMHYVPFGDRFILHPRAFVLGVTLEWMRIPKAYGGYVTSRSSWGRRGLIIATAVGVHPGFSGCLTLELTNVGETPLSLCPGTAICQLFLHETSGGHIDTADSTILAGKRKPVLGKVAYDKFAAALKKHGFGTPESSVVEPSRTDAGSVPQRPAEQE